MSIVKGGLRLMDPSRRDFLRKGAAATAFVWSAPAILSLPGARAWAQGSPCPGCTSSAFGLRVLGQTFGENGCEPVDLSAAGITAEAACGETTAPCGANAEVTNLVVANALINLSATFLSSQAEAPCDCSAPATGSSVINTVTVTAGSVTETVNGVSTCNNSVAPGVLGPLGITLILNEQVCSGDTLTVNALRLTTPAFELIAAQSQAGVEGCGCAACA